MDGWMAFIPAIYAFASAFTVMTILSMHWLFVMFLKCF